MHTTGVQRTIHDAPKHDNVLYNEITRNYPIRYCPREVVVSEVSAAANNDILISRYHRFASKKFVCVT